MPSMILAQDEHASVVSTENSQTAADATDDSTLALNNVAPMSEQSVKEKVTENGPVLLVPMVLVLLALVAVSRRKEQD